MKTYYKTTNEDENRMKAQVKRACVKCFGEDSGTEGRIFSKMENGIYEEVVREDSYGWTIDINEFNVYIESYGL